MKHFIFNIRQDKAAAGHWVGYMGYKKALTFEGREQAEEWLRRMRAIRGGNVSRVQATVAGDRKFF